MKHIGALMVLHVFLLADESFSAPKYDFELVKDPSADDVGIVHHKPVFKVSPKLNGQGRPNISLLKMATPEGYCIADNGVKSALSFQVSNWYNSPAVCPVDTWVCRKTDVAKKPCQTEDN